MGRPIQHDRTWWERETEYCEALINDPPWWHTNYLRMQSNHCRQNGFPDLADRIWAVEWKIHENEEEKYAPHYRERS